MPKNTVLILSIYTSEILMVFSWGGAWGVISITLSAIAATLSILLKVPRVRADVEKYHDGSWKKFFKSFIK